MADMAVEWRAYVELEDGTVWGSTPTQKRDQADKWLAKCVGRRDPIKRGEIQRRESTPWEGPQ